MKNITLITIFVLFTSCAELQQISEEISKSGELTGQQIASGLKEALRKGVEEEVAKLAQEGGFYNNPSVRIELPEQLASVETSLRKVGLGNLTDKGIEALNATAQKAVKEATPIFLNAIQEITFEESKKILLGDNTAATAYLKNKTQEKLYQKFEPVVKSNFQKVGADGIWENLIQKYNQIPFTQNVNPDLTDYVTKEALKGVYKMIEREEIEIRNNINERTTYLLKRVFALQD